jgi:DNA-binding cell septation regulator SpoVG
MPTKAKPAGASGGHRTITVSNWKPLTSGSLRGFLTVTLPSGLIIHNCQLLEAGGKRWIGLPARRFYLADGSIRYQPLVEFTTKRALHNFREAVLRAIEKHLDTE